MSKPLNIAAYAEDCFTIARGCSRPIELEFADPKAAMSFRLHLYGFRRAIRNEGADEQFPHFMRAVLTLNGAQLRISPPEAASPETSAVVARALAKAGLSVTQAAAPIPVPDLPPAAPLFDPYNSYLVTPPPLFPAEPTPGQRSAFEDAVTAWLEATPDEPEK